MKRFLKAVEVVIIVSPAICLPVDALTAAELLNGYVCMSLKANQKYNDWVPGSLPKPPGGADNPPVYRAPSEESERIGYQGGTVIAEWPLNKVNGFIKIIRAPNGQRGWIAENLVVPYHSVAVRSGICEPVVKPDGKIGFHFGVSRLAK
ncbi:MAG TPA: hypothetical protein VMU78_08560 [Methylocella sp.]|nr:hypothetical protein [Methylocella sp.]